MKCRIAFILSYILNICILFTNWGNVFNRNHNQIIVILGFQYKGYSDRRKLWKQSITKIFHILLFYLERNLDGAFQLCLTLFHHIVSLIYCWNSATKYKTLSKINFWLVWTKRFACHFWFSFSCWCCFCSSLSVSWTKRTTTDRPIRNAEMKSKQNKKLTLLEKIVIFFENSKIFS